jgi:hypothetical protein
MKYGLADVRFGTYDYIPWTRASTQKGNVMPNERCPGKVGVFLASTIALGIAPVHLAAASDSPSPIVVSPLLRDGHYRLLRHHMSGPSLPPVICHSDDPRTTRASCEALISHANMELQNLNPSLVKTRPVDPGEIKSKRIKIEKRLADYERTLVVLKARLEIAPPKKSGELDEKFRYAFDPELAPPSQSCTSQNPCNPAWAGDEAEVTVLPPSPPGPCSFGEYINGAYGTLVLPALQPAVTCDGVHAYSDVTSWWVGLGGDKNVTGYGGYADNVLFQAGVQGEVDCQSNGNTTAQVSYFVWQWYTSETSNEAEVPISSFDGHLWPGDQIKFTVLADGDQMSVIITDNDIHYGPAPPTYSMTYPQVAIGEPSNTAEFITERLDNGSRAFHIPIPNPSDQSAAFQSIQAAGNSYYSTGNKKGSHSILVIFPLNQSVGSQPSCANGRDYCGTPFTYQLLATSCETETPVAVVGDGVSSSGGYTYMQGKNPPLLSCPAPS